MRATRGEPRFLSSSIHASNAGIDPRAERSPLRRQRPRRPSARAVGSVEPREVRVGPLERREHLAEARCPLAGFSFALVVDPRLGLGDGEPAHVRQVVQRPEPHRPGDSERRTHAPTAGSSLGARFAAAPERAATPRSSFSSPRSASDVARTARRAARRQCATYPMPSPVHPSFVSIASALSTPEHGPCGWKSENAGVSRRPAHAPRRIASAARPEAPSHVGDVRETNAPE